jgi:hypothetical protein
MGARAERVRTIHRINNRDRKAIRGKRREIGGTNKSDRKTIMEK